MIPGYIEVISHFYPGVDASSGGGNYDYDAIVWNDPGQIISKSILDADMLTLTTMRKKEEIQQYIEDRLTNDGILFDSNHFSTDPEENEFLTQYLLAKSLSLTLTTLDGLSDINSDLISMTLSEMTDLFQAITDYSIQLHNWKFTIFTAIEALTDVNDVDEYDYVSSVPSNDFN